MLSLLSIHLYSKSFKLCFSFLQELLLVLCLINNRDVKYVHRVSEKSKCHGRQKHFQPVV